MTTDFKLLRSRLKSERRFLIEELEQLKASANTIEERRVGGAFSEMAEQAAEILELDKRLALEKRIREQLAGVEHALHKFEEATYGLCDNCGQTIDPERLEALPQASLCINCKGQQPKNAKDKSSPG